MNFKLTILGCNSALPTSERNPTAQVLEVRERFFLIDCGEGTQTEIRKNKIRFGRINQIFISHLHGDHFFGLFGLLSTYTLLQREKPLQIFSPPGLKDIVLPVFKKVQDFFPYKIEFIEINADSPQLIYEDDRVEVTCLPMDHRVPCYGYLFREKEQLYNLKKNAVADYELSLKEINAVRNGNSIEREDGSFIPIQNLVLGRKKARSYAFYADTAYNDQWIEFIREVDLLYHEATFMQSKKDLAEATGHSTTLQAATLAKAAEVKRLLVGHYSSRYRNLDELIAEVRSVFERSDLSYDGMQYEVPIEMEAWKEE